MRINSTVIILYTSTVEEVGREFFWSGIFVVHRQNVEQWGLDPRGFN